MDILRQNMAPIAATSWEMINDQAKAVLRNTLSGRSLVDVEGPKGWDFAAVPVGQLSTPGDQERFGVRYGVREVLPVVEARASFKLNIWELDNAVRGSEAPDFAALDAAAQRIAAFEDHGIYYGFEGAGFKGLKDSSGHDALAYPDKVDDLAGVVSDAVNMLRKASIEGPYALAVSPERWKAIMSSFKGYPLHRVLDKVLGGPIVPAPALHEGLVLSQRGGDFKLTLANDISIGYEQHDSMEVQLYFTEAFAFQVLEPLAVVVLQ